MGAGAWRRGVCHACLARTGKADRRGSFSVHVASGFYHCFKCGVRGRLPGFEGFEPEPDPEHAELRAESRRPPEGFEEIGRGEGAEAFAFRKARAYLEGRGLADRQVWRAARVGATLEGRYAKRVVVPVLSPDGDWLGFVARDWTGFARSPYLYPPAMDRQVLFNHAALLAPSDRPVLVVEGVMDALALWPDAVAVLGKPSEPQVWALADAGRPVAVCLDGDAWREGEELALRLQLEGQRAGNVRLPPRKDPDEVERSWLLDEARRVVA